MIVCFGSTPAIARTMRFDALDLGGVNRARLVHTYAAGKAVNVGRAVLTLGEAVTCVGVEGGATGSQLLSLLERDSIPSRFLKVTAATRICTTVIDDQSRHATELIEDAPPLSSEEGEALFALFESALHGTKLAVLSGSLAKGLKGDFYARCVRIARARGVDVLLDASGDALREAIPEKPAFIKINGMELAGLSGASSFASDRDRADAAGTVAKQTGGLVIVTAGNGSTIAVDSEGSLRSVSPMHVEPVVSAIGCGDSFAAGVAVARVRGEPVAAQLALGTACALANLQTPHAAHFDRHAALAWQSRVRVD